MLLSLDFIDLDKFHNMSLNASWKRDRTHHKIQIETWMEISLAVFNYWHYVIGRDTHILGLYNLKNDLIDGIWIESFI